MTPIDIEAEEKTQVTCFLVIPFGVNPRELEGLVTTLSMNIVGTSFLPAQTSSGNISRYGIGTGKAQEIADTAQETQADCIIFDEDISPTRQRNWEKLARVPVFDRQEVILRIFAARARTKEAVLQVELARLTYSLPRLAHSYGDMARQRGGSYGSKGAGETKLELDRRSVQNRIVQVKRNLEKVVKEREIQRSRRSKIPLPTCAIVGYTNAGKSTLLNALTGAQVTAEDKLFATLDPTTRRLSIAGGTSLLLTDTVGFISNLPHTLIDAFKSTLEEACRAHLLLIVIDASDPDAPQQYDTVCKVLEEIGATENQRLVVLNKTDHIQQSDMGYTDIRQTILEGKFSNALKISAKTGAGLKELTTAISELLAGTETAYCIPMDRLSLLTEIRRKGCITEEQWLDEGVKIAARIGKSSQLQELLAPYKI